MFLNFTIWGEVTLEFPGKLKPGNRAYYHFVYNFYVSEVPWNSGKCESLSKSRNHSYQHSNDSLQHLKSYSRTRTKCWLRHQFYYVTKQQKSEREIFDSLFHAINSRLRGVERKRDIFCCLLLCVCNGMLGKESVWPWMFSSPSLNQHRDILSLHIINVFRMDFFPLTFLIHSSFVLNDAY